LQEVARKVEKFELDLAGEQDVSCDSCGTEPADDYKIFYAHENDNNVIWIYQQLQCCISFRDRMSYTATTTCP